MRIKIGAPLSFKRIGRRAYQEDSRYPDEDRPEGCAPFFLVCDGVGGCANGELASTTVCRAVAQALNDTDWNKNFTDDDLHAVLSHACKALDRVSDADNHDMATTLALVCFHNEGCLAAHVGDSRIYHVRPDIGILYRSEDHSLVNALVHSGNITPDEVANHPRNNVITRSLSATFGNGEPTMATVMHINDLQAGDYFFLCTDGVLDGLTDSTLLAILSTPLPDEEKLGHLADRCLKSHDNHTAYLIPIASVEYNTALKATNETSTSFRQDGRNTDRFNQKSQQVHEVAIRTNKPRNRMVAFIRKLLFL